MDPPEILQAFADDLRLRLESEWVVERPRIGLLFLATLLHDVGKAATRTVGPDGRVRFRGHEVTGAELSLSRLDSLRFSRQESQWMSRVVRHHLRPLWLSSSPPISDRARHRFYRAAQDAGPEICLLSLADNRVKGLSKREWSLLEQGLSRLLEGFFRAYSQLVAPPALVRGTDLLARSEKTRGPWVGRLLEEIKEAQAAGEVETREQALALADAILGREDGDTGA
jgi:putative nucleotidyltransferase with HDIG domain